MKELTATPVETASQFAGHTPGPWELRSDLPYTAHGIVIFSGYWEENRTICRLREGTKEEREANAKLIIAAPDLLKKNVELESQLTQVREELRNCKLAYGKLFNENAALEGRLDEAE